MPDGGDPAAGDAPIFDDPAVHQPNLALAAFGYGGIMGDQQQGRPVPGVLLEQAIDDELTGIAVEIAGGLVGEQQLRSGDEGAGDRHALLLAARQLAGIMGRGGGRGRPSRGLAQRAAKASARPPSSSGIATFSSAVIVGNR